MSSTQGPGPCRSGVLENIRRATSMSSRASAFAAALAVLSLTAFAPAPLPRRETREKDSLSVTALAGEWRATALYQTGNAAQRDPAANGISHVTITPTQWIFNKRNSPTTYDLQIDHLKRPAEVNLMYVGMKDAY